MKMISNRLLLMSLLFLPGFATAWAQSTQGFQKYLEAANQAYQSGNYELSIQYDRDAIKLNPQSATAYQGLGNGYYKIGNKPEALKAFDQSLALHPNNPALADFVRGLRAEDGRPAEAPATAATDEQKKDIDAEIDEIETEMFKPNWTEQLGLSYSSQPSQTGQGQITSELDFTGTDHLTESGHSFSVGAGAGKQKVEGSSTAYGKLLLDGGLGLGVFLPSLDAQFERGQTALSSNALTANLNFQFWEPLTVGMSFSGTLESHNGPASLVGGTSGTTVQIDDEDYSGSLVSTFQAWEFLGFTLTGEQEYDDTFQIEGLGKKHLTKPINEVDRIDSISLMVDIIFLKNFELQLTGQTGVENLPAGTVYSRIQAQTVTLTQATTEPFKGYTFALLYNFD